ncbi:MAG: helix-turn-helix transcriptional regulator [Acidobacteria bacterium]|nr:helix-turn-helix transcriptional regulator [Acidobacteriota bacterium]
MVVDYETFRRLCRSRDYVAADLGRPLRLEDAAGAACLSPFHYHRLFSRTFGETPHDFLTRVRLERARQLLAASDEPVTQVCLAVGYESLGSFSTRFRSAVGLSPQEYRRSLRRIFPVPAIPPHRFIPTCFLRFFGERQF